MTESQVPTWAQNVDPAGVPVHPMRYSQFVNSPIAQAHKAIREEIISELHLDFDRRENGMHAVCILCRGSIAPLTDTRSDHEVGYVYTLDALATLFMAHFMQRHYEQEGRKG